MVIKPPIQLPNHPNLCLPVHPLVVLEPLKTGDGNYLCGGYLAGETAMVATGNGLSWAESTHELYNKYTAKLKLYVPTG